MVPLVFVQIVYELYHKFIYPHSPIKHKFSEEPYQFILLNGFIPIIYVWFEIRMPFNNTTRQVDDKYGHPQSCCTFLICTESYVLFHLADLQEIRVLDAAFVCSIFGIGA